MSYNNSFSIKVTESPSVKKTIKVCPKCNSKFGKKSGDFCQNDGSKLTDSEEYLEVSDIIKKFRKTTEDSHLIKNNGSSNEEGSGYVIEEDLLEFSKSYPNGVFELTVKPDSGFDEPDYRLYYKNGKKQRVESIVTFGEYDETKLS